ncbi:variable large family protein, partial [Borrelia duttonii]
MIMMMMVVVMGCNSGGVAGGEGAAGAAGGGGRGLSGAMMEVGRSAENAFYAFLELVSDVLGFTAKATTKKNEVGTYFSGLGQKLIEASEELEEVAQKSEAGVDKSGSSKNIIKEVINSAKGVLGTLKGYLESLGTVGDSKPVGDAETTAKQGTAANQDELKKAYNAFKGIVELATNSGVKALEAGTITLSIDS